LLGDLPSLNKKSADKEKVLSDKDVNIALSLEYNNRTKSKDFLKAESKRESDSNMHDPNIPKVGFEKSEYWCIYNAPKFNET
jgi:hypothetical protein